MAVKVFVDANLLFYKLISDLLFDASNLGLIEAHWSEAVIAEYLEHGPRVLNEKRRRDSKPVDTTLAADMIYRKSELFKQHSGFILVDEYEGVKISDKILKDKDDIHVLKAAIKSNCSVLLTLDKGFRKISSLSDLDIVAKKADEFFCDLFDRHEDQMMDVIRRTRADLARQKERDIHFSELVKMMKSGRLVGLAGRLEDFLVR